MNENYIVSNPEIMMGKPVIAGTRITVELILEKLKAGETILQIKNSYPSLSEDEIRATLLWETKIILSLVKKELKQLYSDNLVEIILYGSYARGDYNANSDIDLLVILKKIESIGKEIDRIVDAVYDISLNYNSLISVVPISYKDYKNINSPLMLNVKQEGVLVE
ncbi:MAG: DUF433 domain-containing protein [Ignavibacteriaceae bacterium]|nr:DUF433 domain-containing protein [Ignavibacterium sp.]MCC6254774.1 DUF433 domain-containing protein [Ignavibacteriaceae bacterium]HRN27876.1 DUF433 domain-containing protein [Ignavibacteriaceae bacterium]HRP94167.1 DUF433 domain-containing protein [Ignavibacteriaceae bacterium]HRQ55549.1 DUF433 domain-containing protein [Ignavibacteriaceae bacterium]